MDHAKEPISLRNARLFKSVITRSGPMQRFTRMKMSQDALLDAFILLYDECHKDSLRKDTNISFFVNKYRSLVSELRSLRVNLNDFDMKAVIGRGRFGEVRVVREKQTSDIYAMKVLKKSKTLNNQSAALFEEEHDIMCTALSSWLTTMQYSFQDNENLYFVMEYHPGGDLLTLMERNKGTLPPSTARFYLAEVALAIKALHQMGYVHRDIKPDNILLDRCGHVKLVDFGSSSKLSASGFVTASMPVGTPEYIAPEILDSLNDSSCDKTKRHRYGLECDYWSLGILAYEMVVGRTPFSSDQLTKTYFNIMNHKKKLKYPEDVVIPEALQDLIHKLLEDQSVRLKHDGLVKHAFFREVDWNNIRNEAPPFVPSLSSFDDTSNFIEVEKKKTGPHLDGKDTRREFSGKHLPFIGFTFSQDTDVKTKKDTKNLEDSVLEKKDGGLDTILAVTRRENQQLLSKLYEAQYGKNGELETLEKRLEEKKKLLELCETERDRLQREVAKAQAENSSLRRALDLDRQDRKDVEAKALNLIRQNKLKLERDVSNKISQLNAKIEELNDELTESHTVNNELASKCDRTETELVMAKNDVERLKCLESTYKNKMAKTREFKRLSVVGLESRLEQMANESQNQTTSLQQKLTEETTAKLALVERMKETEAAWTLKEAQFEREVKEYEEKMVRLEEKLSCQHMEIASLQVKLQEKPGVTLLQERLETERNECSRLRARIINIEAELSNTTQSFTDHESAIAAHEESVSALEKELRQVSEEKIRLQKKLQRTKETEEENRQKLSNLEVVVDRLEQGVLKLEAENIKLKQQQQQIVGVQPLTSEAETRYQERITILEDQVAKLDSQLQKLRETAVKDKETFKSTQTTLWRTEKELADSKIDIRIAKREVKTSEDLIKKLQDELKELKEKMGDNQQKVHEDVLAERQKFDAVSLELAHMRTELAQCELDKKLLKSQLEKFEEVKKSEKQLKKEHNEICQQFKILEKQVVALKEEKEVLKQSCQAADMQKVKLEAAMEDLKHKICSLELNNNVLKETGAMLDEQLEDYEMFVTNQSERIDQMTLEKERLERELSETEGELRNARQNMNEEKSLKIRAEQRVRYLDSELTAKEDQVEDLQKELANLNKLVEDLKQQVVNYEEKITAVTLDVKDWRRMYEALSDECKWVKQEATSHLTNLYSLKESNYKLTHELEEQNQLTDALQDRICELENVITELEAFHRQREVKDEATKQQQNKLISFLQTKLDDSKKKKTLTNMLFGSRTKENVPPVSALTSPPSGRSSTEHLARNRLSPSTKQAIEQIVKSPSSQTYFQRQSSLQRMHHNIPHRFKVQLVIRPGKCVGCHESINRGSQVSACKNCEVQAHPKCAPTIPKTCGLPAGFAKHYTKSLATSEKAECVTGGTCDREKLATLEGWVKIPKSGKTSWEKKYSRLEGNHLLIFEHEPRNSQLAPIHKWNLCPVDGQVVIGETVESSELPNTARSDLPYIIKIAMIPKTTCWPQETHYLMVLTPSEKPSWLSALNSVVISDKMPEIVQRYRGTVMYSFPSDEPLKVNCLAQINEKLLLAGTEEGLFSLKLSGESRDPVRIRGVSKVHQVSLAPHIGVAVMITEDAKSLVECDHRALVSNAEAASCSNPNISVRTVDLSSAVEPCLMFSISGNIEGSVYLTAATSTRVIFLKWCVKNSQFVVTRVLETLHPCSCVLYTNQSVIVGCDKFFKIDVQDFVAREFLDPTIKSLAFWRIGSFPIQIFEITRNEYLLCFNEFGVFVDDNGVKTQSDLKWSKVPHDFAWCSPYLFVVHMSSIEVIKLPKSESKPCEDTDSIASTATIQDTYHVTLSNPQYIGRSKTPGAIFVRSNMDILMVEGNKLYRNEMGSCTTLATVSENKVNVSREDDEFSFTSSIVQCLDDLETSTPRLSDASDTCTYTISDNEHRKVTFVKHSAL